MRQSEKSRIIAPALQQAVESSVAELEEATFGRGKWFDIQDDMLDQDKTDAEYVRNLLQEDLEKTGVKDAVCEIFLNGAIYGTGIGKIVIEQNIERSPVEQPVEGTMTTTRQLTERPSIDVKLEPISPKEFLMTLLLILLTKHWVLHMRLSNLDTILLKVLSLVFIVMFL